MLTQTAPYAAYLGRYPTLAETTLCYPMPDARVVLVAHILDTAVPFVRTLAAATNIDAVIAVPYSARPRACAELAADMPVFIPESLDEVGRLAARHAVRIAGGSSAPVIINEVGGYCADLVGKLASTDGIRGIVEDTKQGQWRYERQMPLPLPVFTIADSPLKALEDSQVGRSVAYSVEHLLRTRFYRLVTEQRVAVLGYGGIGSATARCLRSLGAEVAVYDINPIRNAQATVDGHRIFAREALLRWADVVVGVSGSRSLTAQDLDLVRDGVILASGSSKQVEFDVDGIRGASVVKRQAGEVAELVHGGRTAFLINEGRPLNFLHQSILGNVLDVVYSELYMCMRELARAAWQPGLHRLDPALQQEIGRLWCRNHTLAGHDA